MTQIEAPTGQEAPAGKRKRGMNMSCIYRTHCNGRDCGKEYCPKKYRLDNLFRQSMLSEAQSVHKVLKIDADGTDKDEFTKLVQLESNIRQFVQEGCNLYLHSTICGNGKTQWAIRLLRAYFFGIWQKTNYECQGLFVSVPRYLQALKDSITTPNEYAEFISRNILKADLVVFDDIGSKLGSEFEINHLMNAINTRMDLGKSNIFTSNLGKREMTAAVGERLASRICNKSLDIEFHGADKRFLDLLSMEENK